MILISKELKKYVLGQGLGFLRLMTLNFQAKSHLNIKANVLVFLIRSDPLFHSIKPWYYWMHTLVIIRQSSQWQIHYDPI